jgi:F-type H+-transporting ATPase subunit delta
MNESLIRVRYAKALFELAEERKILDSVKKDMDLYGECIAESKEFNVFLESPLIKVSEKSRLVDELFKDNVEKLSLDFLHLLVKNKREAYLSQICQNYIDEYKSKLGIKEANIFTANTLSEEYRKQILEFISKKLKLNIELKSIVDPSMIGGFVLRIEDQQINASIKSQLKKIKRELINS